MKTSSKEHFLQNPLKANLIRSLRAINLHTNRQRKSLESKKLSSQTFLRTSTSLSNPLSNLHKPSKSSKERIKHISDLFNITESSNSLYSEETSNHANHKQEKFRLEIESKKLELAEKQKKLQQREEFAKNYQLEIKNKEKEIFKKSRELNIQQNGCNRIVAEIIVKGIIEDLIWDTIFTSIRRQELSICSRKQACLAALGKMKSLLIVLEDMKRNLEKQALALISERSKSNQGKYRRVYPIKSLMASDTLRKLGTKSASQLRIVVKN